MKNNNVIVRFADAILRFRWWVMLATLSQKLSIVRKQQEQHFFGFRLSDY